MTDETPIDDAPQTLRQRLMPQASIKSLIVLSAGCAVIMWLVRAMLIGDFLWAKCVGAVLLTITGCFIAYAVLFLLAHLFTVVTSPIVEAIESTPLGGASPDQATPDNDVPGDAATAGPEGQGG